MSTLDADAPLPQVRADLRPVLLVLALAAIALPLVGSFSTWLTLTFAGLAMGMIIFIVASGMTLVFGDGRAELRPWPVHRHWRLPGGHVLGAMGDWTQSGSLWMNLAAVLPAMIVGMLVAGAVGLAFEARHRAAGLWPAPEADPDHHGRHDHRRRADQDDLGPADHSRCRCRKRCAARCCWAMPPSKFRIVALVGGLAVLGGMLWLLNRTKLGLLIRAGVEDREMVESLGYRIRHLFVGVFVAGSMLAGLGGALWGCTSSRCRSWARRSTC